MTDSLISEFYGWLDEEEEGSPNREEEEEEEEEETAALEEVRIVLPPPGCSSTPAAYSSLCTSSEAEQYAETYKVPPEYGLRAPLAEERAHAPPPGYATVYTHHFRCGLKLPLQPFVASVLAHYEIPLAQLHPRGIFLVLGFLEICRKSSVSPTLTLFRRFFRLQKSLRANGWYTFCPFWRNKIVDGLSVCVSHWKKYFLYFKTAPMAENLNLSWNYSPTINPPIADNDRPSAQTINRILSYVKTSSKHIQLPLEQDVEKMIEADTTTAFALKACSSKNGTMKAAGEMQVNKSSMENESYSQRGPAACGLNATELPSAACRQERLKRKAEFDATMHAKTLRGPTEKKFVDECSQVPSVPSFKDMTLDQFATYNQKCLRSFYLQHQGDKEESEKVVDSLKTEVSRLQSAKEENLKVKENEITLLQRDKEKLEKVVDSLKTEVSMLQYAKEENLKDREYEITSLQNDKEKLEKAVDSLKTEASILQGDLKESLNKIASLQRKKEDVEIENASLKAEVFKLQSTSDDRGPLFKVVEKVMATMEQEAKHKDEEIVSLKSQLKSVVDDRGPLLRVYTRKLLESQAFGRLFYDLTTSAQRLGRHEAAEQIQDRFPAIPEDALVGLQDPLAAFKLENLLCDMIHDDAFKFTLLDRLLSLPEIPSSSQLKHLDVDEDQDSMIASPWGSFVVKLE